MSNNFNVFIITSNYNASARIETDYFKSLSFRYHFEVNDREACYTA